MGRLRDAYDKQRQYAKNEYLSGDETKGDEHAAKAEAFLDRLIAGEDAEGEPETNGADEPAEDEPLSDDMAEAAQQLLVRYGFERGSSPSGAEIVAASPDKGRLAAVVGLLGQPGAVPGADYSLFEEGHEPTSPPDEENGLQSWAPKAEWAQSGSYWKHVNSGGS